MPTLLSADVQKIVVTAGAKYMYTSKRSVEKLVRCLHNSLLPI